MKSVYVSILPLLLSIGVANAAEADLPQVLPESVAQQLLANDPALAAADGAYASAQIRAQQQLLSPYDWVAKGQVQRRDYRAGTGKPSGANSNEWNIGIERSFRLPAKVSADAAGSLAGSQLASLQQRQARRQVASALVDAWFDWLDADARLSLLKRQQLEVAENVMAVAKRVKSGDAAALEQKLATAELATTQRQVSEATYAEAVAWTGLAERYQASPALKPSHVPDPTPLPHDAVWWQAQLLSANDAISVARAQVIAAEADLQRAQADRQPDPTLGVFTASEAYGHERIIGVTASIPLGGKRRALEVERQQAQASSARLALTLTEREQRAASLNRYRAATGAYERWQLAQQGAAIMADNARLTLKAYALGECDVQSLLQARRLSHAASADEAAAKVAALRADTLLRLDAQLLWGAWLNRVE